MTRRTACRLIFLFGIACFLIVVFFSDAIKYRLTLQSNASAINPTFLQLDTEQEAVTGLQLCRNVLRRTHSFRDSLLAECEHLAGDHPVFKTFLENTLDYVLWHNSATAKTAPGRRSLTWKCLLRGRGCGGYGDQIRGMSYAFVLASLTKRMLYIRWPDLYTAKTENARDAFEETMFVPSAVNWSLPSFLSNITTVQFSDHGPHNEARGICKALFSRTQHITYSVMHWHSTCFNETLLMQNSVPSVALKEFIKLPRNVLECAATIIIRLLLTFSKAVREKKKEFKRTLGIDPHTQFAAVHIRTGMFPSGLNENVGRLHKSDRSWEKDIICAMNKSKALGILGPLVLISDSVQCKQWAKTAFGKNVLISNVNPVHVSIDTQSKSTLSMKEKEQRYQSVLATTAELALLSDAEVVFMAASGFSRASAWLGGLSSDHKLCCNPLCNSYYHLVYD